MTTSIESGKCRVCGCTEVTPCRIAGEDYWEPCSWVDVARTLCSNTRCVAEVPTAELVSMI